MTDKKNLDDEDSFLPTGASGSQKPIPSKSRYLDEEENDDSWFRPDRAPPPLDSDADYQFKNDERRTLVMATSIVVVFSFIAVLWYLYTQQQKPQVIPLFAADPSPVKIIPDDPGGMPIENLERTIYDTVSGETMKLTDKVQPNPETPMESSKNETVDKRSTRSVEKDSSLSKTKQTATAVSSSSTKSGGYVMQLGAFRSRENAKQAWDKIKEKYQQSLAPYEHDIQRTVKSDGSIIYRLRAGYFSNRAAVEMMCRQLKSQGQECLSSER